ncbi:hypothetical protein [Shimia sagamensis]|uniref:N-acetyltransferase domain-containing protein n=1 Tax=Shimia sagamensis TaxID=1566352 RepID=A0ABY1PEG0_9RHOB|nr:hypothetical protein [Shimia sagamensis]SMP32025.1 hypothetical protein SAMN06265373_108118 [Shimia sagamensis]
MRTLAQAARLGRLVAYLEEKGFDVEEVTDPSEIADLVTDVGKPYLTPMSSPLQNDFTEGNILCLVARRDGVPVMMGCARLEDLGSETVGRYWSRVFSRAYARGESDRVVGAVLPTIEDEIRGRLVYFGDLFVSKEVRGSRLALRAFVAIGHLAVSLKWKPNWTYCFIKESDGMLSTAGIYGFNRIFGRPFQWGIEPPAPRSNSELLVAVSSDDLPAMTGLVMQAVERSGAARAGAS